MSQEYPYIQEKKRLKNIECERCMGEFSEGFKIEWRVSWFQGDCEFETVCEECLSKIEEKLEESEKMAARIREACKAREAKFFQSLRERLEKKYSVHCFTPYQWRINGVVDIYPVGKRFHDIKRNTRGDYLDVFKFLSDFFKTHGSPTTSTKT